MHTTKQMAISGLLIITYEWQIFKIFLIFWMYPECEDS